MCLAPSCFILITFLSPERNLMFHLLKAPRSPFSLYHFHAFQCSLVPLCLLTRGEQDCFSCHLLFLLKDTSPFPQKCRYCIPSVCHVWFWKSLLHVLIQTNCSSISCLRSEVFFQLLTRKSGHFLPDGYCITECMIVCNCISRMRPIFPFPFMLWKEVLLI